MSVTTESKKKTATEKKVYDPEEIKVRRVNFSFSKSNPRFYYKNNPFSTHFINALHIVFPTGERFFVNSVLKHQKKITDEGKQFSGSQSLARYYDSLRSYVYDKEISPYQQQLKTLKQQQQWLEQAEFVEADLQKVTKTHNDLSQNIQQHKELLHTKRQQYSVELERYTDQNYRCQLLRQFLGFLQHQEVAPHTRQLRLQAHERA
ncbi:metal-dependent hydrolase [uncultured Acinetobacter sp.]|uniref:metal-dependent hydrolase n=1 Tax=uncultured Acinetobacter sp. TaxID=165433 RepID=UPI002617E08B|nr:metal-dependent hydrolase [uncultured Acinetobacter sp.]